MYCDIIIAATEIITIAKTENGVECERDTDAQIIENAMKLCWLNCDTYPSFTEEDPTDEVKDLLSECHLLDKPEVEIIKCEVVDAKCKNDRNGCFYIVSDWSEGLSESIRDSEIFCINVCYLKFVPCWDDFSYDLYYNVPDDAIEKNPEDNE